MSQVKKAMWMSLPWPRSAGASLYPCDFCQGRSSVGEQELLSALCAGKGTRRDHAEPSLPSIISETSRDKAFPAKYCAIIRRRKSAQLAEALDLSCRKYHHHQEQGQGASIAMVKPRQHQCRSWLAEQAQQQTQHAATHERPPTRHWLLESPPCAWNVLISAIVPAKRL